MLIALAALALLAAGPPRPGEDAPHHADRLRTEQLNRAAAATVARRQQGDDRLDRAYRTKQAEYERQMAAWRERDAARRRYNAGLR